MRIGAYSIDWAICGNLQPDQAPKIPQIAQQMRSGGRGRASPGLRGTAQRSRVVASGFSSTKSSITVAISASGTMKRNNGTSASLYDSTTTV